MADQQPHRRHPVSVHGDTICRFLPVWPSDLSASVAIVMRVVAIVRSIVRMLVRLVKRPHVIILVRFQFSSRLL